MFTINDLKTGHRVVLHNGEVGLYILEGDKQPYIYGKDGQKLTGHIRLYEGEDNDRINEGYMIEEVYGIKNNCWFWTLEDEELLWSYEECVVKRKKADELKKKMDQIINEMYGNKKYEMYADINPELKSLLDQYKKLIG